jgi:membrane protease YdiL (CAAX protease family)
MKSFLRSVLPAEGSQLGLLLGVLCLFTAVHLRWAPWGFYNLHRGLPGIRVLALIAFCAVRLSACLGFIVCFRPGAHPIRRLLYWVCLPAALGIVLMCSVYVVSHQVRLLRLLASLGPGFRYALLGFILVSIFTAWLTLGRASLPLALPESSVNALDRSGPWRRVETFLWVMLSLIPTITWAFPFMNLISYFVKALIPSISNMAAMSVQVFVQDAIIVLIAIRIIGLGTWQAVRCSVRLPRFDGFALAIVFPVGIAALISVAEFLYDLLRYTVHQSHNVGLPWIGSYFTLPKITMLLLLLSSFGEEVIFRGVLQPRFIRRYGLFGGLVLLSVVFAASHIDVDLSDGIGFTNGLVILKVGVRLLSSLGLCFVAGWLTLRTRSVLPAALAHGLCNIVGVSPFGPTFPGIGPVIDILWIALAYALFRYWPVRAEAVQESSGGANAQSILH